jgi:hypothetical protein
MDIILQLNNSLKLWVIISEEKLVFRRTKSPFPPSQLPIKISKCKLPSNDKGPFHSKWHPSKIIYTSYK